MRRRKRPRDPEAFLICTRCHKIKAAHLFSYDTVNGKYFCYCKQCKSILYGLYDEQRAKEDPAYLKQRRERLRRDNARRTRERREEYRAVQNRLSFFVNKIHATGMTFKAIGEHVGLTRQTIAKIAKNAPEYRLRYADARRITPILEDMYYDFVGRG